MVEEVYVSFETAKLLKEKGFEEKTYCNYYLGGKFNGKFEESSNLNWNKFFKTPIAAPTQAMAMKWLREVHNIHIDICSIWDDIHWLYQVFVITPRTARNSYVDKMLYTSYEQACEVAIKYCLKNLI